MANPSLKMESAKWAGRWKRNAVAHLVMPVLKPIKRAMWSISTSSKNKEVCKNIRFRSWIGMEILHPPDIRGFVDFGHAAMWWCFPCGCWTHTWRLNQYVHDKIKKTLLLKKSWENVFSKEMSSVREFGLRLRRRAWLVLRKISGKNSFKRMTPNRRRKTN